MAPASEFNPAEFPNYTFGARGVEGPRGLLRPRTNPRTGYRYYRLRDADGVSRDVSVHLAHGDVVCEGGRFHVADVPACGATLDLFPDYVFFTAPPAVARVVFASPRSKPRFIQPDRHGRTRLVDFKGDTHRVHLETLL